MPIFYSLLPPSVLGPWPPRGRLVGQSCGGFEWR
jgi:hypothetical protein